MEMNQKLKPCPFCGGEATAYKDKTSKYHTIEVLRRFTWFEAKCEECGVRLGIPFDDSCRDDDAMRTIIDAWNRRAK